MITLDDEKIATSITEQIKNLLGGKLEKVILFGSRARGDATEESDFDFVIVANFEEPSWIARNSFNRKNIKVADLYDISVDYVPVTA